MTGGLLLAGLAAALCSAALVIWLGLIRRVELGERRWIVNATLGVAMALALAAFTQRPGLVGGVLAGVSLLLGALYLGLLALARQSRQAPAVAVGSPLLDFGAPDQDGERFELASLRGRPVLLKFFRGHW
jgi:hypothetical protein